MKGTKLWQDAGSPLISGESRRRRPFAADWFKASLAAFVVGGGAMVAVMTFNGSGFETALRAFWLPAIPGAMLGAAPAVWFARRVGARAPWIAGAVGGTVVVAVVTVGFTAFLVTRLGG